MKLFLYFIAMLSLPLAVLVARNGAVMEILPMVASTLGLAMLLWGLVSLIRKGSIHLSGLLGAGLLLAALLVRFILGFLYDFSGRGFSSDVFSHLNPAALQIAIQEYDNQLMVMLLLFALIAYFAMRFNRKQMQLPFSYNIALLPVAGLLLYFGADASPELQLAQAYQHYARGNPIEETRTRSEVRKQTSELLKPLRPAAALPVERSQLEAHAPKKPTNLVLIYLESFNETFTESKQYPGLTPRIDALKKRLYSFDQIHSSSYVTIEGIGNSQCGTLMNMEYANSSLVTRTGRLTDLPCLADILQVAGYQQTFFGGAELVFAGKGAFLRDHGYDDVNGWEHWDDKGYERFGDWGLSDVKLFNEAYDAILEKHQKQQPFNVTMLTLGTHVPGFVYPECPIYSDKENALFLNSIHCTDYLLGDFIDRLEKAGVLKDTVLLAQADHGVFIRPDVYKLFGQSVTDTRLLTLLSLPDNIKLSDQQLGLHRVGSNLDTVASLLDLLDIEHNNNFIFSKSHFDPQSEQPYFMTRRLDFAEKKRVRNDRYKCDDSARSGPLTLPLDNCDKDRAMRAVSSLNLSYARKDNGENRVCKLSAETGIDPETGQVLIKWGNQNLSDQFYRRGSKRNKHNIEGIYAVLLNNEDKVTQSLFFEPDREEDMRDIREVFQTASKGDRMLFVRNADMDSLEPIINKMWPDFLRDKNIVYGEFDGQNLVPEFTLESQNLESHFKPQSCAG